MGGARSVESYLANLLTYLIALAIVGANPCPDVPKSAKEEFGGNSFDFILIPLDVLMSYFYRVSRCAARVPSHLKLAWLERVEVDERAAWVSAFRVGQASLGKITHVGVPSNLLWV